MSIFVEYSKYYDSLYKEKDYKKEVDFILRVLSKYHHNDANKETLSLGCGTGSYEIILAQKGYTITGVDRSKSMLDIANNKISSLNLLNQITLKKADIRNLKINNKFDIALAMFNVIGYQNSNDDLSETLKSTSDLLKKGGIFMFDCWHAPAVLIDRPVKRERTIRNGGKTIIRKTDSVLYPTKDLVEISFTVIEKNKNKQESTINETHTMRYFTIPELEYFLKISGFKMLSVYNFLDLKSKVKDDKWDIFVVAEKK